jgi:hypothetical protein
MDEDDHDDGEDVEQDLHDYRSSQGTAKWTVERFGEAISKR